MQVRLSDDARDFLRREVRHLRQHSPAAARRLVAALDKARANLSRFPQMGAEAEAAPVPGARRLIVGDYVLVYDLSERGVSITSIRRGAMLPEASGLDDDLGAEPDDSASPSR